MDSDMLFYRHCIDVCHWMKPALWCGLSLVHQNTQAGVHSDKEARPSVAQCLIAHQRVVAAGLLAPGQESDLQHFSSSCLIVEDHIRELGNGGRRHQLSPSSVHLHQSIPISTASTHRLVTEICFVQYIMHTTPKKIWTVRLKIKIKLINIYQVFVCTNLW